MISVFARWLLGLLFAAALAHSQPPSVIDAVHKGHSVGHEQDGLVRFARLWLAGAM
jgi:hypothetical protein